VVLEKLADGALNLTSVRLLAPHLTETNHVEVLAAAEHKSKRQVEELVARLQPLPDARALIRRLPAAGRSAAGSPTAGLPAAESPTTQPAVQLPVPAQAAPGLPPVLRQAWANAASVHQRTPAPAQAPAPAVTPLAPERYRIQFTASAETHAKLRRAQDLLRHQIPDGDPAAVIDRALGVLIAQLEKSKIGRVDRPRRVQSSNAGRGDVPQRARVAGPAARGVMPGGAASSKQRRSRYIPAAVRRVVWQRDDGRCAFIGRDGRRCDERGFLEFHHVEPFAPGGEASVENIELRCRAHNQYEADLYFAGGPATRPSQVRECEAEYASAVANWIRAQLSQPRHFSLC
jgi:hypothetical protein